MFFHKFRRGLCGRLRGGRRLYRLGGDIAEMDRSADTRGSRATAKAIDGPDGFDAGFRGEKFVHGALPPRTDFVAIVPGAIDAFGSEFGRRKRGVFSELAVFFEERADFVLDF